MQPPYVYLEYLAVAAFFLVQVGYTLSLALNFFFISLPKNLVTQEEIEAAENEKCPYIVLFYPVLKELEGTMRTTFTSLSTIRYPKNRYKVVAIPNANDYATVESLRRLQQEFPFLQMVEVPPTSDPTWQPIWDKWEKTENAYWWHKGPRAGNRNLPPKKTRQLIYAFYKVALHFEGRADFLVNYIDADSCPPADHFLAGAAGMKRFDVLQAQNIAGNLNDTMAATWHAADHMAWDGLTYPHLTADGKQPYWVLGKGLFFKASDLLALGGFHPWTTIEDPEVGMRFWVNGKKLGVIVNPLIEEVPSTLMHGITQRKRWVCGFFQSLTKPLTYMGYSPWQKFRAWLNFLPCLSISLNSIGIPIGLWAAWATLQGSVHIPLPGLYLAMLNMLLFAFLLARLYWSVWQRSTLVLDTVPQRIWYLIRINPVSLMIWWIIWLIPLYIGFRMYLKDEGLTWERTEKTNANMQLITAQVEALERESNAA
jgi:cellulose synthase/poly-beta-1,6-N-acetylglucosamine synthase-like glycosyltransferase